MNPLLLFRTLKPLRWEQLVYRPIRIAQNRIYRYAPSLALLPRNKAAPVPDAAAVRALRSLLRQQFVHLHPDPQSSADGLRAIADNRFTFLNRTLRIEKIDWNRRCESHLWNYHLHYFDWIVGAAFEFSDGRDDLPMEAGQRLIESWVRDARVGECDGWDAYPVSLRAVNWIYAYALIAERWPDQRFLRAMLASLYAQLDFLSRHLELHLLANHLLKNIKALVVGGIFFGESRWIETGVRLLWREFDEQVLDDGGHYERSPMYHAQALADFLECYSLLVATGRAMVPPGIESGLCRMAGFLDAMTGPDAMPALFNDSANTAQTRSGPLLSAAGLICGYRQDDHLRAFPSTGYFLWVSENRAERMIVDAGEPAVDYNTAHAHCDLLSYVLWMDGQPLVVDSGVHGYGGDPYREYCRSTRAHNTVMFDGVEQSEVWSTFRMGRRAELIDASAVEDEGRWIFRGSYRRFDGGLVHTRRIEWDGRDAGGGWTIFDASTAGARAESFVHLHPGVEVTGVDTGKMSVDCRRGSQSYRVTAFGANWIEVLCGRVNPAQGWYFPDFGIAQEAPVIRISNLVEPGREFGYSIVRI